MGIHLKLDHNPPGRSRPTIRETLIYGILEFIIYLGNFYTVFHQAKSLALMSSHMHASVVN